MKVNLTHASAKTTAAGKSSIWGSIILLPSKREVDWDGQSLEEGMKLLAEMKGTKYGTDWKWAGDLPPEECDIAIRLKNGRAYDFGGPTALQDLFNLARKSGAVKTTKAAGDNKLPNSLKITMSNTRSATAGDFSWRVIAARLRTSVVKYMHVAGSKPNDDGGFKDAMLHGDDFWPVNTDGDLDRMIRKYANELAGTGDSGKDNQYFEFVADEVMNCLEEIQDRVVSFYSNGWNFPPGFTKPTTMGWRLNGRPSNTEVLAEIVAYELLDLQPPKVKPMKAAPKIKVVGAKGLKLLPAAIADCKKADYEWQAPVLKLLEQVQPKMKSDVYYKLVDEMWALLSQPSRGILAKLTQRMVNAIKASGGSPAALKNVIRRADMNWDEKLVDAVAAEFSRHLPNDNLVKEFASAGLSVKTCMGL